MKIGLLGSNGYIGSLFLKELRDRSIDIKIINRDGSRKIESYEDIDFLINAAGYTGKPNVDECENNKQKCFNDNVDLVSFLCLNVKCPFLHVSSGCIFEGDRGFKEDDKPNFKGSYYSRTKILAEQVINNSRNDCYIARLRIPFDENKSDRNYLIKLLKYKNLINEYNSISYLPDFINSCLFLILNKCEYGIYNITNPEKINSKQIIEIFNKNGLDLNPNFISTDELMLNCLAKRSNCTLDSYKINKLYKMKNTFDAVEQCIKSLI